MNFGAQFQNLLKLLLFFIFGSLLVQNLFISIQENIGRLYVKLFYPAYWS
jgi:hypothetical protein